MAARDWPEIYFVRHGETDWNAEGRYQGSRDVPLNDVGRAQADRSAVSSNCADQKEHHGAAKRKLGSRSL